MQACRRTRSVSEPALRLQCGSVSRERRRDSNVGYERGRDRAALWISRWSPDEVCEVLYQLVCRCSQAQLDTLLTSLESVPHRDLQLSAVGEASGLELRPVSTPLSREVRVRLRKSRRPQNRYLHRPQSAIIHHESPLRASPLPSLPLTDPHTRPPSLDTTRLPGLPFPPSPCPSPHTTSQTPRHSPSPHNHSSHHTLPSPPITSLSGRCSSLSTRSLMSPVLPRTLTTPRRHMLTPPTPDDLSTSRSTSPSASRSRHPRPPEATHLLTWFSSLTASWQRLEVVQMVVTNLDPCELYFFAALLMSRQFRDFVLCLPLALALRLLSFVPPKDLLKSCTRVSRAWHRQCTSEDLWKRLCLKTKLGVPVMGGLSWRGLFRDSLRMKRNWWRGHYQSRILQGHTGRVLCVRMRGSLMATGSSDCTVRIWDMESGRCVKVLSGHTKGVWCVCFYGKRLLISGSSDHSIKVWNIETGSCERSVEAHSGPVWSLQLRRELLLTGSQDKTALLWRVRALRPQQRLEGHGGVVMAVELSDSATTAFTGAGDGVVRVWDVCSGECVRSVGQRGAPPITALSWSKGYLAWSAGCMVLVWNTDSWERLSEMKGHEDRVECVQLKMHEVGTGRGLVVTASRDCTLRYWSSRTGGCIQTLRGHTAAVNAVCSDPQCIASTSDDHTLRLWNFHTPTPTIDTIP